jgi:predicted sulfurtransferase
MRDKIVAGLVDKTFDVTNIGIPAKEFNELLEIPIPLWSICATTTESEIGHLQNAIKPDVDSLVPLLKNN